MNKTPDNHGSTIKANSDKWQASGPNTLLRIINGHECKLSRVMDGGYPTKKWCASLDGREVGRFGMFLKTAASVVTKAAIGCEVKVEAGQ